MKRKKPSEKAVRLSKSLRNGQKDIPSDVLGSYTGMGEKGEHPEQDADDL